MVAPVRGWAPAFFALSFLAPAGAQTAEPPYEAIGAKVEKRINGIIALLGFQAIPDITTTSLSISEPASGDPEIVLGQFGAGFTWSDDFPLYLEGMVGYSRYDPRFLVSDGSDTREVPFQWNSTAATIGIGWDIRLMDNLVLRPVVSATIGYIASDAKVVGFVLNEKLGADVQFLTSGGMNAWGYGGSLVLDYENYSPEREIDIELRYSQMRLESYGGERAIQASANVGSVNLWARWRAPISDWTAFDRPVRYALEITHSEFLYDQRGILGFDRLTSLGAGLELDLEESRFIDRARIMGRYVFGDNVSGFSVGFAVTF
jgi:hypothetical protein